MAGLRIYADYNAIGRSEGGPFVNLLDTLGSLRDLTNAGVRLPDGLPVTVVDARLPAKPRARAGGRSGRQQLKRTWPIIAVRDVQASSRWYQLILASANSHQGGSVFDQILDTDGTVLLCLHHWGDHGRPSLMNPDAAPPGNGLLLFLRVDDFDTALQRARARVGRFEEEPHTNTNTGTMEFSLRDPDGYYVRINAA